MLGKNGWSSGERVIRGWGLEGEWEGCFDFGKEGEGLAGRGLRTVMVEGRQCMVCSGFGKVQMEVFTHSVWVRVGVAFVMMRRRHKRTVVRRRYH